MLFWKLVTLEKARGLLAPYLPLVPETKEVLHLLAALGRRTAEEIQAKEAVPGFARATVDGYAVRAQDTFGASESEPAYLKVSGEILMGEEAPPGELPPGTAVQVATGGMLPGGADAVVMAEHTEVISGQAIEVLQPVGPGENVIQAGEEFKPGDVLLATGELVTASRLGLLAAAGITELEVYAPLRVGIISTGDELVPPTVTPRPGQVRDVNTYLLAGLVRSEGGTPQTFGIVPDDFSLLKEKLSEALGQNDLVLISGGSSVGTRDLTVAVISSLGKPGMLFHGLALRPGKPTLGAVIGNKIILGLPGHPAAAAVVFELLVRPLISKGSYEEKESFRVWARLSRSISSAGGREEYIRVKLKEEDNILWADPLLGKSGLIGTVARADGMLHVPLDKEGFAAGERVPVQLFR